MAHPLNRDLGAHPMPNDPETARLAEQAARVAFRAMPYLAFRYGSRGRRFSASDSAYLAMVGAWPAAARERQLTWLGLVLGSRGMPTLLLEAQLRLIARALARGGKPEPAGALHEAAAAIASRRACVLRPEDQDAVGEAFARSVASIAPHGLARGTGRLIACAVADEALGIDRAVPTLTAWLCDPAYFDPRWSSAVDAAVRHARSRRRVVATAESSVVP